jgi:CRP-like cAMP-binding protein
MQQIISLSQKSIALNRNEFLKIGDTVDTNIYFITQGSVRVFILDKDEEQTIRLGYKDNLIVALDSFLTNKKSPLCIQVIKRTTVKVITKQQFNEFIKQKDNHEIWRKVLETLVLQQLEREIDILTNSPKERLERVLSRSPQLFQEIPNKHIANYLRMSAETLSRLRKS